MCDLSHPFRAFPALALKHDDRTALQSLRYREPDLVGLIDGMAPDEYTELAVLGIHHGGENLGVGSALVVTNSRRGSESNLYGRVDLIIVDPAFRGMGLGRAVILCLLLHMLKTHGSRLYSISSLAAHGAVAKVLEDLGFQRGNREAKNFVTESLALEAGDHDAVIDICLGELESVLRLINFRLRQRKTPS